MIAEYGHCEKCRRWQRANRNLHIDQGRSRARCMSCGWLLPVDGLIRNDEWPYSMMEAGESLWEIREPDHPKNNCLGARAAIVYPRTSQHPIYENEPHPLDARIILDRLPTNSVRSKIRS